MRIGVHEGVSDPIDVVLINWEMDRDVATS